MAKNKKDEISESLLKEIAAMEAQKRDEGAKEQTPVIIEDMCEEPKISFDQWWMGASRRGGNKLPRHVKEIIFADMKARGLRKEEPASRYDWGLEQYGIKL